MLQLLDFRNICKYVCTFKCNFIYLVPPRHKINVGGAAKLQQGACLAHCTVLIFLKWGYVILKKTVILDTSKEYCF